MSQRYLRCLLGPLNGTRVYMGSQETWYEAAVFPEMRLSDALSPPTCNTPIGAVVRREIYVVKIIRWKEEEIPILVPSRYTEKELDAAIVESLFR